MGKNLKVGDRIITIEKIDSIPKNITGTIIKVTIRCNYLIEFDKNLDLHSGGGSGKSGHCWWIAVTDLSKIKKIGSSVISAKVKVNDILNKLNEIIEKYD